jgi:hypothetical protein
VWPYCLAGAGLGLQLHDLLRGTDFHGVFDSWFADVCRSRYLHLDADELPQLVTLYYDPILDVHHEVPTMFGMVPTQYLAPQAVGDAQRLFEAGVTQMGIWEPSAPILPTGPRSSAAVMWMAREWGLDALASAMSDAIDAAYEPTWDATRGEFTWGFGLNEPQPRGQYNGTMAAAQIASERSWWQVANVGPGTRFDDPTVCEVDVPAVVLSEAWWDADREELTVGVEPLPSLQGTTTFTVTQLPDARRFAATGDGPHISARVDGDVLRVEVAAVPQRIVIALAG